MLSLVDKKGGYTELEYPKPMNYEVSEKGLYETWVHVIKSDCFNSSSICLPIFTEWF